MVLGSLLRAKDHQCVRALLLLMQFQSSLCLERFECCNAFRLIGNDDSTEELLFALDLPSMTGRKNTGHRVGAMLQGGGSIHTTQATHYIVAAPSSCQLQQQQGCKVNPPPKERDQTDRLRRLLPPSRKDCSITVC
uniref:Putative secreted protein n=1 Tax=Anopheles darlingi TaxID=43151 RepID=A0A2M4DJH3_ANODA